MLEVELMAPALTAARLGRRTAWAAAALVAVGCAAPGPPGGPAGGGAGTTAAPSSGATAVPADAPAARAPAAAAAIQVRCSTEQPPPPTGEPDFTLFGYPRVGAKARFTPGAVTRIAASGIALELPPDLYTSPLDFELLTGDAAVWQPCVEANQTVIAPYAYRVTDPATGQRVGRFDKPVQVTVTDPRLTGAVAYWITSAQNPARVRAAATPPVQGASIQVENGSARLGWFTTVPKS